MINEKKDPLITIPYLTKLQYNNFKATFMVPIIKLYLICDITHYNIMKLMLSFIQL